MKANPNPIRISFSHSAQLAGKVPVKVEFIGGDAKKHTPLAWLPLRGGGEMSVPTGDYLLRATFPSGRIITRQVSVSGDPDQHINVDLTSITKGKVQASWNFMQRSLDTKVESLNQGRYKGLWVRRWEKTKAGWQLAPMSIYKDEWFLSDEGVNYTLHAPEDRLSFFQVGGNNVAWKLVALPTGKVHVMVLAAESSRDTAEVQVRTINEYANSLLSFTARGMMREADSLVAGGLIMEKLLEDGATAVAAGYYLFKAHKNGQICEVLDLLERKYDWLPDGKLLAAWQLMYGQNKEQLEEADLKRQFAELLLAAVDRGIPMYTMGVQMLQEGLEMALGSEPAEEQKKALEEAVAFYRKLRTALEWNSLYTSFRGESPGTPNPRSRKGKADSEEYLAKVSPGVDYRTLEVEPLVEESRIVEKLPGKKKAKGLVEVAAEMAEETSRLDPRDIARAVAGLMDKGIVVKEEADSGKTRVSVVPPTTIRKKEKRKGIAQSSKLREGKKLPKRSGKKQVKKPPSGKEKRIRFRTGPRQTRVVAAHKPEGLQIGALDEKLLSVDEKAALEMIREGQIRISLKDDQQVDDPKKLKKAIEERIFEQRIGKDNVLL